MVDYNLLRSLEQECSAIVCPDCGGQHAVSLEVKGGVVRILSAGTEHCPGFKGAVMNHLNSRQFALMRAVNDIP